jgi:hypothetical protein
MTSCVHYRGVAYKESVRMIFVPTRHLVLCIALEHWDPYHVRPLLADLSIG